VEGPRPENAHASLNADSSLPDIVRRIVLERSVDRFDALLLQACEIVLHLLGRSGV
jgi:hypothetical protein